MTVLVDPSVAQAAQSRAHADARRGPEPGRAAAERRRRELAAIHIAVKRLGLDDESYRKMLKGAAGVRSAADLDAAGRAAMLDSLRGRPTPAPDKRRMIAKIRALLGRRPEAYAEAILQRLTGHDHRVPLAWGAPEQLRKVIAALQYDANRKRKRK